MATALGTELQEEYGFVFARQWPAWLGGLLLGVVNVFLFIFYQPWTTLDGVLNWGSWIWGSVGVLRPDEVSPLLRSGSVVNLGLVAGALAAALAARQFGITVGPPRELAKGLVGGLLLGTGAALARGCNIGGFFSATSAFALNGLGMAVGLAAGAFIGARYLVWEAERAGSASLADLPSASSRPSRLRQLQPAFGLLGVGLLVAATFAYVRAGFADRAVILLLGVALGVISQRSRVCFVRAFREPFLTGESSHTRAMLLGLVVSIVGFALVKGAIETKIDDFVRPTFWIGGVVGGLIFGIGMVIGGGCGAGSLWRAGEGHVKLWLAVIGYVLAAPLVTEWLRRAGVANSLGQAVLLPDVLGWEWSVAALLGLVAIWYLAVRWNEATGRLAAI